MTTKFSYDKLKIKRTDRLNEIIKSTKTMIINSSKFNSYLSDYIHAVQIPAFKTPEIACYPILKNFFLIPLNKMHYHEEEQKQKEKLKLKGNNRSISSIRIQKSAKPLPNLSTSQDVIQNQTSNISSSIYQVSNKKVLRVKSAAACVSLTQKNNCLNRDNSYYRRGCLINAFFPDWCFVDIVYDESVIFNREAYYKKFINEKLNYIKNNNIENITSVISGKFNEDSDREMAITLSSMKIEFKDKSNKKKATVIYLPFAYLFLFYFKGIEYFQHILLGFIKFNEESDHIILDEKCLYDALRSNPSLLNLNTNPNSTTEENVKDNKHRDSFSTQKSKHHTNYNINTNIAINKKEGIEHQSMGFPSRKELRHYNTLSQNAYNNYSFTWLANDIYIINISLPEVLIKLKHNQVNVSRYIDKELILFLLEKNFINWDFYIINFLFSLKDFRLFIEKMLSKKQVGTTDKNIVSALGTSSQSVTTPAITTPSLSTSIVITKSSADLTLKKVTLANTIELSPIKSHDFSLQDYTLSYFYSSDNNKNSLHVLHSYSVSAFFSKMKPVKKYIFDFTFKQMFILNQILIQTGNLEAFIMKILITDSSIGVIQLNYAFFDHFDEEIFKDEQRFDTSDKGNKTHIKEIEILIDKPYLVRIFADTPYRSNDITMMPISNHMISDLEGKDFALWPMILMNQSDLESGARNKKSNKFASGTNQGSSLNLNEGNLRVNTKKKNSQIIQKKIISS